MSLLGQPLHQRLEPHARGLDLVGQGRLLALEPGDALAQHAVLLAQLLKVREKLVELGFESGDVAIHLAKFL